MLENVDRLLRSPTKGCFAHEWERRRPQGVSTLHCEKTQTGQDSRQDKLGNIHSEPYVFLLLPRSPRSGPFGAALTILFTRVTAKIWQTEKIQHSSPKPL